MSAIFINYRVEECTNEAQRLHEGLEKHLGRGVTFFDTKNLKSGDRLPEALAGAIRRCGIFLALIGPQWLRIEFSEGPKKGQLRLHDPGDWVRREIEIALQQNVRIVPVLVNGAKPPDRGELPPSIQSLMDFKASELRDSSWESDLEKLVQELRPHVDPFRLRPYTFAHEKEIMAAYTRSEGLTPEQLADGCPPAWPEVRHRRELLKSPRQEWKNPVPEARIGAYRPLDARVVINVGRRTEVQGPNLTLLEAGPRERLFFHGAERLNVGILVSGGIAPGINAVIHGIVSRHELYREYPYGGRPSPEVNIHGYREGFKSLLAEGGNFRKLRLEEVQHAVNSGGSILATAREDKLMDDQNPSLRHDYIRDMVYRLIHDGIDILYIIGGDGSMRAAHDLGRMAERLMLKKHPPKKVPSIVAVPKTMDNDILWVWQSFGFLSAVDKAKEAIINLHTEVSSNPRLGIVQLFGSDSGFVVSHAALASGVCDLALIPEVPFSMKKVSDYLLGRLHDKLGDGHGSTWGLVVMAETAIPQDAKDYWDEPWIGLTPPEKAAVDAYFNAGRRVRGQTPDELRQGGLKLVSRFLLRALQQHEKSYLRQLRVVTNEPRHLIRATPPSVSDVIFGQRLGALAVDNAMAGFTQFMVSQWVNEYVLVPLELVVVGRKRVPQEGIFWKSVLASTGQKDSLT